jgi:hypothetical protein
MGAPWRRPQAPELRMGTPWLNCSDGVDPETNHSGEMSCPFNW